MPVELTPEQLTAIATVVIAPVIVGTFAIWHEYLKTKKKPDFAVEIPVTLKQLEEDLERIERWQERIIDRLDDMIKMQLMSK